VNAIIFVAALSEYDQVLFEDEVTNRMVEALTLFESIANHPSFSSTSIILFLNKKDLFADKVKRVDISSIKPFNDYSGVPFSYADGVEYFNQRFESQIKSTDTSKQKMFTHVTCATDTSNIDFVFRSVHEIIVTQSLEDCGFMS